MKLISLDPKHTQAKVKPEGGQDLWRLSELIEPGDLVTARTERKVKLAEDAQVRKPMVLSIIVEKTEVNGDVLRIAGTIAEGTDDAPKGLHHTIGIEAHHELTITKEWTGWQLEKLREEDSPLILVLLMDREEAVFAALRREPEVLGTVKGSVAKKGMDGGSPFWQELADTLVAYEERLAPRHVIVASPAFFKEYVLNLLPEPILKKTVAATISATGSSAMAELVRRPELKHVLQQERYTHEVTLMDQLLQAIHTEKGAWGEKEVGEMAQAGALLFVLVSKNLLQRTREEGRYESLRTIMHDAERTKAQVHVLDTTAAQQLDTLGGIGGVRRW